MRSSRAACAAAPRVLLPRELARQSYVTSASVRVFSSALPASLGPDRASPAPIPQASGTWATTARPSARGRAASTTSSGTSSRAATRRAATCSARSRARCAPTARAARARGAAVRGRYLVPRRARTRRSRRRDARLSEAAAAAATPRRVARRRVGGRGRPVRQPATRPSWHARGSTRCARASPARDENADSADSTPRAYWRCTSRRRRCTRRPAGRRLAGSRAAGAGGGDGEPRPAEAVRHGARGGTATRLARRRAASARRLAEHGLRLPLGQRRERVGRAAATCRSRGPGQYAEGGVRAPRRLAGGHTEHALRGRGARAYVCRARSCT